MAPPFREVEFDIMFGAGISREGDLLDLAVENGIIDKSGAWFSYKKDRLGQGRENVKTFLRDNPEVCAEIEGLIREKAGLVKAAPETDESEADAGKA
jgi:recombination protein RecA